MSDYQIPYSEAGAFFSAQRDKEVEKALRFFINQIGVEKWPQRRLAIESRLRSKLDAAPGTVPIEGISLRERDDEFGWYLYLAEQSIADPPSLDTDQASRVLPYINAIGRNLDSILKISGINRRLERLAFPLKNQDPDQALFELLVGACYVNEGWDVLAVDETSSKTSDFLIRQGEIEFDVECKRLTRRSDYTDRERDAWLRQWQPVQHWLVTMKIPLIVTITFYSELEDLPEGFLLSLLVKGTAQLLKDGHLDVPGRCSVQGHLADFSSIGREVDANYIKCSSSRERQVVTGIHRPDHGFTSAVSGYYVAMGSEPTRMNKYWTNINFVAGAYWRCEAQGAIEAKARNIKKRLADANQQLSGKRPGIIHIGIEASEGDRVEVLRSERIREVLSGFDPKGKPLEWVFINYFKGEAPPDQAWVFDETFLWQKIGSHPGTRPLSGSFLVLPPEADSRPGVHWD